ncbi:hypothetical protein J2847_006195 [Azospirillum agricola]|uniref:hypothetical protein n=1 Tax=Azospirillum agricola TaxID=1720247 RepID=UPI001AE610EC|nr:hypothetical protein [Azospirillum agricola]MBP2232861.1 hypothetical protein [Azospirillum agricola]
MLKGKRSTIPAFTKGSDGRAAPLTRQCTMDYKIEPIRQKVRELLGVKPRGRVPAGAHVEQWIGISTDEAARMKPSRDAWCEHRWPLIEMRMSRWDCISWFEKRYPGRVLAKSACIGCPYHSNAAWREMRDNDPASWADAVAFDEAIRAGFAGNRGSIYLHRSLRPLPEVDLRTAEDLGQINMFINECEGMCGV